MTALNEARMPALKDKLEARGIEAKKVEEPIEEKIEKKKKVEKIIKTKKSK